MYCNKLNIYLSPPYILVYFISFLRPTTVLQTTGVGVLQQYCIVITCNESVCVLYLCPIPLYDKKIYHVGKTMK